MKKQTNKIIAGAGNVMRKIKLSKDGGMTEVVYACGVGEESCSEELTFKLRLK